MSTTKLRLRPKTDARVKVEAEELELTLLIHSYHLVIHANVDSKDQPNSIQFLHSHAHAPKHRAAPQLLHQPGVQQNQGV